MSRRPQTSVHSLCKQARGRFNPPHTLPLQPILTATPPPSLETQVNGKRTQTSTDPPSLRSSTASGSQRREAAAVGQPSQAPRPHPRGRQAYVPLMSMEGQSRVSTHLPGRHPCQCLAQKHSLINNCVECGRIVCSQVLAGCVEGVLKVRAGSLDCNQLAAG